MAQPQPAEGTDGGDGPQATLQIPQGGRERRLDPVTVLEERADHPHPT